MYFNSFQYVFAFLPLIWLLCRLAGGRTLADLHARRKIASPAKTSPSGQDSNAGSEGLPRLAGTSLRNLILLAGSYLFYTWGNPKLILYIGISSLVDYWVALRLEETEERRARRRLILLSMAVNLGMLCFFKYARWVTSSMNALAASAHVPFSVPVLDPPLPPGISFYTFQTMSYTLDVYWGRARAARNLIDFLAYVSFFPQLVAGPIERITTLFPQLVEKKPPASARQLERGVFLIVFGLVKKTVFADNLGYLVGECLHRLDTHPGIGFLAVFAFSFQIYCDFSAYTDIARGSAELFNIQLSRNFMTPYFADSPSDFWRRWHITLSRWLRDYLYIPLGGNRKGGLRTLANLMTVMFLGGLWHGAGVCFILWGIYHGCLLVFYRLFPVNEWLARLGKAGNAAAILIMFTLTGIGWMIFMSHPYPVLPALLGNMGRALGSGFTEEFAVWLYPVLLFSLPVYALDFAGYLERAEFSDLHAKWSPWTKVFAYYLMFYLICFFARRGGYAFIYFTF